MSKLRGARATTPSRLVLLGHPLGHTLSPLLHGAALASARRDVSYSAFDVPPSQLDEALSQLARENAAGNVTIPHKPAVAERCVRRTAIAERAGAVNTFWFEEGELVGHNTDLGGFDASARALIGDVRASRVALLGAGGAAAGVLAAIESWPGATVRLWTRTRERAHALGSRFACDVAERVEVALADATLIVNATPLGLRDDDAFPAAIEALPPHGAVLDLVYRRGETRWVHSARAAGHRASDGLPMLVEQAALAEECWFGGEADREAMWSAIGGRPGWMREDANA